MRRSTLCCAILVALLGNGTSDALRLRSGQAQGSKPGPEHKKLEYFVGTWTYEIDGKASPFGPPGKTTGKDRVELGPGGFTLVFNTELSGPAGNLKALGIGGYDPSAKSYTWYGVDSTGGVTTGKGSVAGNTWTWTTESNVAGKTVKGRNTSVIASPTAYAWKFEIADEKGVYSIVEEGKATKAK